MALTDREDRLGDLAHYAYRALPGVNHFVVRALARREISPSELFERVEVLLDEKEGELLYDVKQISVKREALRRMQTEIDEPRLVDWANRFLDPV